MISHMYHFTSLCQTWLKVHSKRCPRQTADGLGGQTRVINTKLAVDYIVATGNTEFPFYVYKTIYNGKCSRILLEHKINNAYIDYW